MRTQRFVPIDELRQLARGSYEQVIAAVDKVVSENVERLFGENVEAEVIATFPGHALVLAESGRLIKVYFERAETPGRLQIQRTEQVETSSYSGDTVEDYVRKLVREAIDAWTSGRIDEAESLMAKASVHVADRPLSTDKQVVESVLRELCASRTWKQLLESHGDAIRSTVGPSVVEQLETASDPKFRPLYSGSLVEETARQYRDLVRSDIDYLANKVESLKDTVEASFDVAKSVIRSQNLEGEEVASTLILFTEDLLLDLRRLHQVLSEAKKLTKVDCLGRLHDAVVAGLPNYEIAGRFVAATSEKLRESSRRI